MPKAGGPRRPFSSADLNRWAVRKRISKLESSASSTVSIDPLAGSSGNQRRWRTPPNGTIACHPSGARRNSPPATPVTSNLYGPTCAPAVVARNDRTVDRASGAQKIDCLSKAAWGSAAKREPPLLSELVWHRD